MTKVKERVQDKEVTENRTYIFKELLSQLLDVVHDFVRTGFLLSNPLHMIGNQLWMQDKEAALSFSFKLLVSRASDATQALPVCSPQITDFILTSSNRSVALYGGPLSDTKPANAIPSSTFTRKSSSVSAL